MKTKNIVLMFLLVLMSVSTLFAGSKTRAQWLYGLPVDNKLYLGTDNYIADDTTNHEINFSTNVNITGNAAVSGTTDGRDVSADGTVLDNVKASTGTIQAQLTSVAVSTGTLRNETIVSTAAQVTATALVQTNLNTTNASTGTLDTNKLNLSGGTMTGSIASSDGYQISYSTVAVKQVLRMINLGSDPANVYLTTGTIWMRDYDIYISTGWVNSTPTKAKFELVPIP